MMDRPLTSTPDLKPDPQIITDAPSQADPQSPVRPPVEPPPEKPLPEKPPQKGDVLHG